MINLDSYFCGKPNALNLARLFLALMVLISHVGWFYGRDNTQIRSLGVYSVAAFFGISGFLISQSAFVAKSFFQFTLRRIKRIYPAFLAVVLVTSFIYYPTYILIQSGSLTNVELGQQFRYVVQNFILHVFKDSIENSLSSSATINWNPSLWTLQFEFLFYLGTYAVCKKLDSTLRLILPVLTLIFVALTNLIPNQNTFYHFFYLGQFYLFGMTLWEFRLRLFVSTKRIGLMVFGGILSYIYLDSFAVTSFVLILLILFVPIQMKNCLSTKSDFSYGVYLHAGPITHLVVLVVKKHELPYLASYVSIVALSVIVAAASWFYIESKFATQRKISR